MLTNPYNPLGIQWQENHIVVGRVSQDDFYFLKQKYPYYPGLIDKLISNLFKITIDELRRRDRETPIATALYIDDPSFKILDDIISRFAGLEGRPVGEYSVGGPTFTQYVSGAADRIRAEMQRIKEQQPDAQGGATSGIGSSESATKEEKQRRTSSRTTRTTQKRTRKGNKEVE